MRFEKTAKLAVTAGLCLSMTFGGAPMTAFATTVADAPKADESADKTIYVEYNGLLYPVSDKAGNPDMDLVNAAVENIQARLDEQYGKGKKSVEVTHDEAGKWSVVVSNKGDESTDKTVHVDYNGLLYPISDKAGNIDMDLVNTAAKNIQERLDEQFGKGKKSVEITHDENSTEWYVKVTDVKEDVQTAHVTYRDPMGDYVWDQTVTNGNGWYFDLSGIVSHEGYTFTGWSMDAKGGEIIDPSDALTLTGDVTLYAQWTKNEEASHLNITYRDTLDADRAWTWTGAPADNWFFNPQANGAMEHPGYTFAGWSMDAKGGEILDPAEALTLTGDVTLYAQWTKNEEAAHLNITYRDSLDGDYSWEQRGVEADDWFFNPEANGALSHEGYKFVGWSLDEKNGEILNPTEAMTLVGDVTLYAQWAPVEEASHLNLYFRDSMDDDYLWTWTGAPADDWYFNPQSNQAIEHEGYTFVGWSYDKDGKEPVAANDLETTTGDVTLYAQWKKDEQASHLNVIYLDSMDADYQWTWTGAPQDNWFFDPSANGAMEHEGYEFAGWTYDKEGKLPVEKDALLTTTGDVMVWAQWKKTEEPVADVHTVTFQDLFNKTVHKVEVKDGETVTVPVDPSYDGWKFVGWSTSDSEFVEYDFSAPVTEDMTLTACYSKNAEEKPGDEDAVKPSEKDDSKAEAKPVKKDEKKSDEKALPQTGDNSAAAIAGAAIAGAAVIAAGVTMKRRQNN